MSICTSHTHKEKKGEKKIDRENIHKKTSCQKMISGGRENKFMMAQQIQEVVYKI